MKKEEFYEAIEGIDEKYIEEAESAVLKKRSPLWMKLTASAAVLCLCFCSTISVLAATDNEAAYELLYSVSPYIAQKLKPVNLSCEDNGIEMTVTAAEVDGDTATILIALRDITGDRLDETTDIFDFPNIHTPYDQYGGCSFHSYDADTKTATFLLTITQMNHVLIPGDKITFSFSQLLTKKDHSNLEIKQIDTRDLPSITEVITQSISTGINEYEDLTFIKPDEENAVELTKGVALTGYGIEDGKLHIQIRYDDIGNTDNHGFLYLKDKEGNVIEVTDMECFPQFYTEEDSNTDRYYEYICPVAAEDLADYEIWGEFWTCNDGPIEGNWQVTFPIEKNKE